MKKEITQCKNNLNNINIYFNDINFVNHFPQNIKDIKEIKGDNIKINDNIKQKDNIICEINKKIVIYMKVN